MLSDKQKKIGETREKLAAIGGDSEKEGIKWTQHFMDEHDRKEWQADQQILDRLSKFRNNRQEYYRICHDILKDQVSGLQRPNYGYWFESGWNKQGVWLKLHDRFKKSHTRAFRPCGDPKVDYFGAINTLWGWIEDKMLDLENSDTPLDSGVFLP